MLNLQQLEIDNGGSIYTMEMGKYYNCGFSFFLSVFSGSWFTNIPLAPALKLQLDTVLVVSQNISFIIKTKDVNIYKSILIMPR